MVNIELCTFRLNSTDKSVHRRQGIAYYYTLHSSPYQTQYYTVFNIFIFLDLKYCYPLEREDQYSSIHNVIRIPKKNQILF